MFRCKLVNFLISLFPFHKWQDFLIRTHVQKCEICASQMASRDEAKALIIQEDDVKHFRDLWPAIRTGVADRKPEKKALFFLDRKWVFATTGFVALFLAGFLFYSLLFQSGTVGEQEGKVKFQINSIRVGDEPATPFLYQPKDSDMILIWAEKSM